MIEHTQISLTCLMSTVHAIAGITLPLLSRDRTCSGEFHVPVKYCSRDSGDNFAPDITR